MLKSNCYSIAVLFPVLFSRPCSNCLPRLPAGRSHGPHGSEAASERRARGSPDSSPTEASILRCSRRSRPRCSRAMPGPRQRGSCSRLCASPGATAGQLKTALRALLLELLAPLEQTLDLSGKKPCIVMLAGVNGSGKTTSIGKLARYFQDQGRSVLLAAGDTFRAAAREQLAAWGEKNSVAVVAQSGGDPGAVVFDAVAAARARGIDVVIADTAGRLPTQLHLM